MSGLRKLPREFARIFMSGLIHVCRVDGHICPAEVAELHRLARGFGLEALEEDQLMESDDMTPAALVVAIRLAVGAAAPYRSEPLPSERELKELFLDAAFRCASADFELRPEELTLLKELTETFGLPPRVGALFFGGDR
jgi:tellurite resistance protein